MLITFEEEVRLVFEGVVRLLHGDEAGVNRLAVLIVPGLSDQLSSELQDQTENAVDEVHDRGCFVCQQTPKEARNEEEEVNNEAQNVE